MVVVDHPTSLDEAHTYTRRMGPEESTPLPWRTLGAAGLSVSAVGYGAMGLAPGIYGEVDDDESRATLRRALELGVTLIDTADVYGAGHSERLVGEVIQGQREKVKVATKFGGGGADGMGRPEYVESAVNASLERLGTDHIDLLYLHRVDGTTPIEETVGAMADAVRAGKALHIGLSEAAPETIRRAHATHALTAVQSEYSLFSRDPEAEVLPVLRELGIGFVAYSPLGRGLLAGVIKRDEDLPDRDWRRSVPRFRGDNLVHNAELVAGLERFAERKSVTVGQLALAWVLHQGQDIVPIPGTRRRTNLELNVAAASIAVDAGDLAEIDAIVSPEAVAGRRGNSAYMERVNG